MWLDTINPWLSFLGSIASLVGLIISVIVWIGVRNITNFYVSRLTIPEQMKRLHTLRKDCVTLFNGTFDSENKLKMTDMLIDGSVQVESISKNLRRLNKSEFKHSIEEKEREFKEMYEKFKNDKLKSSARDASDSLYQFILAVENIMREETWRRNQ